MCAVRLWLCAVCGRNMTRAWAGAIKASYPNVKVMGGVAGGWWGMWCSALDGGGWHCQQNTTQPRITVTVPHLTQLTLSLSGLCGWVCCAGPEQPGPDFLSHNNTYYYPWLFQQINAHKLEHGVCLLDYIDHHWSDLPIHRPHSLQPVMIHPLPILRCCSSLRISVRVVSICVCRRYPYLNGVDSEKDPAVQSALLDQPRSLYDLTFVDPAGNKNPDTAAAGPAVIRQLHEWLRLYAPDCPDIGIAITEYAFGGARLHTTALALAEVFSIMAREQLSLATLFQIPTPDTSIFHSFELYNFNNSRVTGDSVQANSSADVQLLTAYAQHDDEAGVLYVKLFNKGNVTTVSVDVTVLGVNWTRTGSAPTMADVWQLQAAVDQPVAVYAMPPLKVSSNSTALFVNVECAPRTATVLRLVGLGWSQQSTSSTQVRTARAEAVTE